MPSMNDSQRRSIPVGIFITPHPSEETAPLSLYYNVEKPNTKLRFFGE